MTRKHKSDSLRIIIISFLLVSISSAIVMYGIRFFRVTTLKVIGHDIVIDIDHARFDETFLFFNSDKIKQEILKNPLIKSVSVVRALPSSVEINVQKRDPIARLANGSQEIFIDKEGYALSDAVGGYELPIIIFQTSYISFGEKIGDPKVSFVLRILSTNDDTITFDTFTDNKTGGIRARVGETNIIFPQNDEIEAKLYTLQTLLSGFRIKGELPREIDLRYQKPVIRT